jgi:hypothetical protein
VKAVTALPARVRLVGIGILAASAALLSAGCAAGQHAATAEETPAIDGAAGTNVGNIQIRSVSIAAPSSGTSYPAGANADLIVTFVNNGAQADHLTGIASTNITGWTTFASAADADEAAADAAIQAATAGSSAPESPADSGSAAGSDSTSASGSASSSPSSSPNGSSQSVTIPPGTAVAFGVPSTQQVLVLEGIKPTAPNTALYTASNVSLTFTFADAGTATILVPVQITSSPGTPLPVPSASDDTAGA